MIDYLKNGYKLTIMLTELCNAHCSHCYMSADSDFFNKKTLSTNKIDLLVNCLPKNAIIISVTGGEPYMAKKELVYLLKSLRKKFDQTEIRVETNGCFFYNNEQTIKTALEELIALGVNTVKLSDDKFHQEGGVDLQKVRNVEVIAKKYSLNILVKYLVQDSAVAFGRGEKLKKQDRQIRRCFNSSSSLINPWLYVNVNGDVSTCPWGKAPSLINAFETPFEVISEKLDNPLQRAILEGNIKKAIDISKTKEGEKIKNIADNLGDCIACKYLFEN